MFSAKQDPTNIRRDLWLMLTDEGGLDTGVVSCIYIIRCGLQGLDAELTVYIALKIREIHLIGHNLVGESGTDEKVDRELARKTELAEQLNGVVVVDGPEIDQSIVHLRGLVDYLGLLAAVLYLVGIDENHRRILAMILKMRLVDYADMALIHKLGTRRHVHTVVEWYSAS